MQLKSILAESLLLVAGPAKSHCEAISESRPSDKAMIYDIS